MELGLHSIWANGVNGEGVRMHGFPRHVPAPPQQNARDLRMTSRKVHVEGRKERDAEHCRMAFRASGR